MGWRESYLEGCRPSEVPWDAHPDERPTMAERLGEFPRAFREVCGSCGCEFLHPDPREGPPICPLCGGRPKVWHHEERE